MYDSLPCCIRKRTTLCQQACQAAPFCFRHTLEAAYHCQHPNLNTQVTGCRMAFESTSPPPPRGRINQKKAACRQLNPTVCKTMMTVKSRLPTRTDNMRVNVQESCPHIKQSRFICISSGMQGTASLWMTKLGQTCHAGQRHWCAFRREYCRKEAPCWESTVPC